MRHVSRTHRVALDWLFDRINLDPKVQIKYVESNNHLADITKRQFHAWWVAQIVASLLIMNDTTFSCSHFYSHSFLSAGKQSEILKRFQESFSPGSPIVKARACCLVSLQCVSVGQDNSSNPKSPGAYKTLKCGPWKKELKNPDGTLFRMPRETQSIVQKMLEVSHKRMPRETESTREKVVQNIKEKMHMDGIYGFIDAGSIAHGPELRKEFGIIQECWIWEHQRFVQN